MTMLLSQDWYRTHKSHPYPHPHNIFIQYQSCAQHWAASHVGASTSYILDKIAAINDEKICQRVSALQSLRGNGRPSDRNQQHGNVPEGERL